MSSPVLPARLSLVGRAMLSAALRLRLLVSAGTLGVVCGCSTAPLSSARYSFYEGQAAVARNELAEYRAQFPPDDDDILVLMERGTICQELGLYEESSRDLIDAADLMDDLETWRLSEEAANVVANDFVKTYRGAYYERVLIHVMTSLNHASIGNWEHMAVESRRMLEVVDEEERGEYPDLAIARYMIGLGFLLTHDRSNAAMQFAIADELTPFVSIAPDGRMNVGSNGVEALQPGEVVAHECIGIVQLGRSPTGRQALDSDFTGGTPGLYLEFLDAEGRVAGRSIPLTDVWDAARATEDIDGPIRAMKAAARMTVKVAIADALASQDEVAILLLAFFWRLIAIDILEAADDRRWETLAGSFHVARFATDVAPQTLRWRLMAAGTSTGRMGEITKPLVTDGRVTMFTFRLLR